MSKSFMFWGEPECVAELDPELEAELEAEIECEQFVLDEAACTSNGCNYSVDEGEPSCSAEPAEPAEVDAEGVEIDCELYVANQELCTSNGCNYAVDEEGKTESCFKE